MPPRKRARAGGDASTSAASQTCDIDCADGALLTSRAHTAGALYEAGELCDGALTLQGRTYAVSRMMLASASPFFKSAFTSTMRESSGTVALDPSLGPSCVEALLQLAHNPAQTISVPEVDLESLMATADQLQLNDMIPKIAKQLSSTVSVSNCLVRLSLGARHSVPELVKSAIRIIDENFAEVGASHAFLTLPWDAIQALLQDDDLETPERALFNGAQAWVQHDAGRASTFGAVLELIRLPELGHVHLISHVMHAPFVVASTRAQELVREALLFLTDPSQRHALSSPRTEPRAAKWLDLKFFASPGVTQVVVTSDGKTVSRTNHPFWKGAKGDQNLDRSGKWTLRVVGTHDTRSSGFFLGVARADVSADDQDTKRKTDCKVGVELHSVQVGDEITITANRFSKRVLISAVLVAGRTELPGLLSLQSELPWDHVSGSDWRPIVQMNDLGCSIQVV